MNFKNIVWAIGRVFTSLWDAVNSVSFVWCISLSLLAKLTEKFLFKDWEYLVFLGVIFAMDWFFGTWWSVKSGTFSFERLYEVIAKVVVYAGILVMGHVLTYFTISGKAAGMSVLTFTFYWLLLSYECHSALKNMGRVYPRAAFIQWAENRLYEIIQTKQKKALGDEQTQS